MITDKNTYYNYIFLDPEKPGEYKYTIENENFNYTHQPFYVGKGKGRRYKQHKYLKSGRFMNSKMLKLKNNNLEPIIVLFNIGKTNNEVCNIEKKFIKNIGRRDLNLGPLCNHTDGGDEGLGRICTEESKLKKSLKLKGKPLSEINKRNIAIAMKGRIPSENTRKGFKEFMKSDKAVEIYGKKVYKIDMDGNILEEYSMIKEAAEKNNINFCLVQALCRNPNRIPRSINFKFKYK